MGVKSGRVTGREIKKNKDRGRATRLLQVEVTAPEDVRTVEHLTQSGEDTSPPDNAQVIIINIGEAWQIAISADDQIEPSVLPGEKKIYSTDQAGITEKAKIHLKQDGEIEVDNGAINIVFSPNGNMTVTSSGEALFDFSDKITLKSADSVTIDAPTLDHNGTNIGEDHRHSQENDSDGDTEVDTGGPHS